MLNNHLQHTSLENHLPAHENGCPYLLLAPMEGLGDRVFRRAIATVGGFDEACTEYIRVPSNAHVSSLASVYDPNEIAPFSLAAQVMGSDPLLMAEMTRELVLRGAPRIDLNCGCPVDKVTKDGSGSGLLKTPELIGEIIYEMRKAVRIPVMLKIRSGWDDDHINSSLITQASCGLEASPKKCLNWLRVSELHWLTPKGRRLSKPCPLSCLSLSQQTRISFRRYFWRSGIGWRNWL